VTRDERAPHPRHRDASTPLRGLHLPRLRLLRPGPSEPPFPQVCRHFAHELCGAAAAGPRWCGGRRGRPVLPRQRRPRRL